MKNQIFKWGNRFAWASLAAGIFALLGYYPSYAQNSQDLSIEVYEPATENQFPVGARSTGMGGAQIAAGDDGSALHYNPALLTRIRNIEISGSLTQQRFSNKTSLFGSPTPEALQNNTALGSLWAIFPVPTSQGGLSLGLGVNRVRSFDRVFRYSSTPDWFNDQSMIGYGGGEDETGSLWEWSFGGAIEVSPKSSVGLSLDIYDGQDDYSAFFDSTFADGTYHFRHNINDSYTGVSGKIGASYSATNWLNLGAVIRFPTSFSIDQTTYTLDGSNENTGDGSYRYVLPFSFGLGSEVDIRDLTLAADISYLDYTQLSYKRGFPDLAEEDRLVREFYRDALSYHLGAEYLIRSANLSLRAGYYVEPIPFKGYPIIEQPKYFTVGAGLLIENSATLDLAYVKGAWKRADVVIGSKEDNNVQRFLATLSFRIM
jgi:long-subunit fatty acid transport protein